MNLLDIVLGPCDLPVAAATRTLRGRARTLLLTELLGSGPAGRFPCFHDSRLAEEH